MAPLVQEAFRRFGAKFLWNARGPAVGEAVDRDRARRIARRLAREGNAEAVALSHRIIRSLEAIDADPVPAGDPARHQRQPVA